MRGILTPLARGYRVTDDYHGRKLAEVRLRMGRLSPQPNPMPSNQVYFEENVNAARRIHCRRYNDCLDLAFAARWDGFTCASCTGYVPMEREDHVRDLEGITGLFLAVRGGR